jgi:hypothetical protein
MRFLRISLIVPFLLLVTPIWAQQTTQPATKAASDPQAVAVVQAAITALGGATAIGQANSWRFHAQMQGAHANGTVDYLISTDTDTGKRMGRNGKMGPAPPIHSHFIPALAARLLLQESQDPTFVMVFGGLSTLNSKPVTIITFVFPDTPGLPAQIWTFDATNLPILVDFRGSAEIGGRGSFPFVVALSDYRQVSGVLYPFQITSFVPGRPPQTVVLDSVAAAAEAPLNDFNGQAGDLQ